MRARLRARGLRRRFGRSCRRPRSVRGARRRRRSTECFRLDQGHADARPVEGPGEAEINYTERSPLVVPPNRDLPPPAARGAARAGLAEGSRNKPRQAKQGQSRNLGSRSRDGSPNRQTRRSQRSPGTIPWNAGSSRKNTPSSPASRCGDLTDPPPGYRIPSPDQPYGVGAPKSEGKSQASRTGPQFGLGDSRRRHGGRERVKPAARKSARRGAQPESHAYAAFVRRIVGQELFTALLQCLPA